MLNIVNGFRIEAGKPLAGNQRIAKIAFTGETTIGRFRFIVRSRMFSDAEVAAPRAD